VVPDMLFPDLNFVCGRDSFLISPIKKAGTHVFYGDWFNGIQVMVHMEGMFPASGGKEKRAA